MDTVIDVVKVPEADPNDMSVGLGGLPIRDDRSITLVTSVDSPQ